MIHTLEKIKLLEKITKELFDLKYSSAAETGDSIKEITANLENTRKEISELLAEGNFDSLYLQSLEEKVEVQDTLRKNWESQQNKVNLLYY